MLANAFKASSPPDKAARSASITKGDGLEFGSVVKSSMSSMSGLADGTFQVHDLLGIDAKQVWIPLADKICNASSLPVYYLCDW